MGKFGLSDENVRNSFSTCAWVSNYSDVFKIRKTTQPCSDIFRAVVAELREKWNGAMGREMASDESPQIWFLKDEGELTGAGLSERKHVLGSWISCIANLIHSAAANRLFLYLSHFMYPVFFPLFLNDTITAPKT